MPLSDFCATRQALQQVRPSSATFAHAKMTMHASPSVELVSSSWGMATRTRKGGLIYIIGRRGTETMVRGGTKAAVSPCVSLAQLRPIGGVSERSL